MTLPWNQAKYSDYKWRFEMTPEERNMAREMGRRHYIMPTWYEQILAWLYQIIP